MTYPTRRTPCAGCQRHRSIMGDYCITCYKLLSSVKAIIDTYSAKTGITFK